MPTGIRDRLRKRLLPLSLAEAELDAKRAAAVMILLRDGSRGPEVLLTLRAKREGDPWSGQIGLPGGMARGEDEALLDTALRETREEVGLDLKGRVDVLGHLPTRPPANRPGMPVVPYVAFLREPMEPRVGKEIRRAFWCPLEVLPRSRTTSVVPEVLGGLLTAPGFQYEGLLIWGFTYRILEELLILVGRID